MKRPFPLGNLVLPLLLLLWSCAPEAQKAVEVAPPPPVIDLRLPLIGVDTTRPLISPAENARQDSMVLIPYVEGGRWGFADTTGQIVIRPKYLAVAQFAHENLTLVRGDKGWGLVDKVGREAILPTFSKGIGRIGNGVYTINLGSQTALINQAGKRIDHGEVTEVYLNDGRNPMAVRTADGFGFMDKSGQMVIAPQYSQVTPMVHGVTCVIEGRRPEWHAIGRNGQPISDLAFEYLFPFTHGYGVGELLHDSLQNQWGVLDSLGRVVIPFTHGHIPGTFQDAYLACPSDNPDADSLHAVTHLIYDRKGRIVAKTPLAIVDNFQEGLAAYVANGKYGFVDTLGRVAIPARYDFVCAFSHGLACVTQGNVDGFIDHQGRVVIPLRYQRPDDCCYMQHDGVMMRGANSGELFYLDRKGREYRNFSR